MCVHGGLELKHLDMDLHQINVATNEWLRGISERPYLIDHEDSPIWNRSFSAPGDRPITEKNARKLEQVLSAMGARRMIVGHTPQIGGINSFVTELGYEVWRTDTGIVPPAPCHHRFNGHHLYSHDVVRAWMILGKY